MSLKTNKTLAKRFTKTCKGKFVHRASGQDHFNARESGNTTRRKRQDAVLAPGVRKAIAKML